MKFNLKSPLTVAMFKAAFCVDEVYHSALASNMALSRDTGYKGYRAKRVGRRKGRCVYTLESLFKVAELMGPSFFKGGVVPALGRHILPAREMVFGDFMAVLFLNGNNVGDIDSDGKLYVSFHNRTKGVRARKFRDGSNGKLYPYDELAAAAEKSGWRVPPLPGVWPRPQGEAVCARETQEERAQPGEMMTTREFRTFVPGLSQQFSMNVACYCGRMGLTEYSTPHRYPYAVLKKYAEKEGKKVPALPSVKKLEQQDKQGELPLESCTVWDDAFIQETRRWRAEMLAEAKEVKLLLRDFLAVWKGEEQ